MKEETGADIIDVKEEPLDEEYLEEDIILVKEWIYSIDIIAQFFIRWEADVSFLNQRRN